MQARVVWLASPMSDGITGKRYVGKFWQPDADVQESQQAALQASVLLPPDRA